MIDEKETGMILISVFHTSSIKLDKIRITCQESIDQQLDIQFFQKVCRDKRRSNIRQQFLTDTKRSDRASKTTVSTGILPIWSEHSLI